MIAWPTLVIALTLAPPISTSQLLLPEFRTVELSNGMKFYVAEDHAAPTVSLALAFPSGAEYETREMRPVASITPAVCLNGIPGMDGTEIWKKVNLLGGSLGGWADFDCSYYSMTSLASTWTEVLGLWAACVRTPTFPEKEFHRIRRQWVTGEAENQEDADHIAGQHLMDLLYEGPLGEPVTPATIRGISREDVIAFHRVHVQPNRAVLVAIGDFDAVAAETALRGVFADWPRGEDPPPQPPSRLRREGPRVRLVHKPGMTQARIRCGGPAPTALDPERQAYKLACMVLGSGFGSRLVTRLRSEGGKTYGASSWHQDQLQYGQLVASTFTRNAEVGAVLDTMRSVLREFTSGGVTADELATVRSMKIGGLLIGYETPDQQVNGLCGLLSRGFSLEECRAIPVRYEEVTLADLNGIVSRTIDPEGLAWVVVGDKRRISPAVSRLGKVEEVYYKAPVHPGNFFRRTRCGFGLRWNSAARGPSIALLHRRVLVSGVYGLRRDDAPWNYGTAGQIAVDLHRRDAEYSSASLYLGATGTFSEAVRGVSPHLGLRLFPYGIANRASASIEAGRSFWDAPRDLPRFYASAGMEIFF